MIQTRFGFVVLRPLALRAAMRREMSQRPPVAVPTPAPVPYDDTDDDVTRRICPLTERQWLHAMCVIVMTPAARKSPDQMRGEGWLLERIVERELRGRRRKTQVGRTEEKR